ncbi:hypothetical protein FNH22_10820 [Fulvivirga sp. M361]|uniref:hypothetical protein n=1 Tax=Fulvivirga sp. M361 TaxID=2594266 RepID=UPI00117A1C23|nr:hypothetical protein [Fulvivirga sp. M361]TRX59014.1 hypothetical protein FNH22_10820 [Fulvivirga sp. M361]
MKNPKSIFFLTYFLFHFGLLVTSIYVNYRSEDFEFLLWMRGHIDWMIYASIFGFILFGVNMILMNLTGRNAKKEASKLRQEANSYKAKMFDLQEATKDGSSEKNTPASDDGVTE